MLTKDDIKAVRELCKFEECTLEEMGTKANHSWIILPKLLDTVERQAEAIEVMREGLNDMVYYSSCEACLYNK